MNWLHQRARLQIARDIGGLYLVECALAAAMVAIAAVACMPSLSTRVGNVFTRIGVLLQARIP
jgi:Flp pilus assembly pilin Flp